MARSVRPYAITALACVTLAGCGFVERPQRPAWRDRAEQACLSQKLVRASAYVRPAPRINGPGICGMQQPFKIAALNDGRVALKTNGTLACPMIASLDRWVKDVAQPAAMARFGQPIAEISSMGTYGCRTINNRAGGRLSEHAFGNAIDIGAFRLADGRQITLVRDWTRGGEQDKAFLRELHAGACDHFTTVLGPGSDVFHYNHFHFDLAMHGNTSRGPRRVCRPKPQQQNLPPKIDNLPDPPELEPELDIARRMQNNRQLAITNPGVNMAPARLRAMPRPNSNMAMTPAPAATGANIYGRVPDISGSGPIHLPPPAPRGSGILRDDGVYVPPGQIGD
ncbi:MAG: extensin family protein [Alphaproteobacteria bacterium]|nr:extensin family protein [Alphaproteobacteria bacterium]